MYKHAAPYKSKPMTLNGSHTRCCCGRVLSGTVFPVSRCNVRTRSSGIIGRPSSSTSTNGNDGDNVDEDADDTDVVEEEDGDQMREDCDGEADACQSILA